MFEYNHNNHLLSGSNITHLKCEGSWGAAADGGRPVCLISSSLWFPAARPAIRPAAALQRRVETCRRTKPRQTRRSSNQQEESLIREQRELQLIIWGRILFDSPSVNFNLVLSAQTNKRPPPSSESEWRGDTDVCLPPQLNEEHVLEEDGSGRGRKTPQTDSWGRNELCCPSTTLLLPLQTLTGSHCQVLY